MTYQKARVNHARKMIVMEAAFTRAIHEKRRGLEVEGTEDLPWYTDEPLRQGVAVG